MDGVGNAFASPVSIIPSAVSKFYPSEGGNENEPSHDQIALSNLKSFKNSPSSTKHFMSPTISAASKAAPPRKKVLAERNGVPDVNQILFAKPFNFSPKTSSPKCSTNGGTDIKSYSSEPFNFDPKTSAKCSTNCCNNVRLCTSEPADDSSLKPYDPITNYLSPRPQFLRYNPNRRHKILVYSENEAGEIKYGLDAKRGLSFDTKKPAFEESLGEDTQGSSVSCSEEGFVTEEDEKMDNDSQDSSISSSDKGSVEEEDEKIDNEDAGDYHVGEVVDEEEEEIEVIEEGGGLSLEGALKILFWMVFLISETLYISSMNSPRLPHNLHGIAGLNFSEGANEPIGILGKTEIGLMEFDQGEINDGFEEEYVIRDDMKGLVEITDELGEVEVEAEHLQVDYVCDGELGCKEESSDQLQVPETAKVEVHEEVFKSIDKSSDQLWGADFTKSEGVRIREMEKAEEGSHEFQGSETAEMSEIQSNSGLDSDEFQGSGTAEMSKIDSNSGLGSDDGKMGSEDGKEPMEEVLKQMVEDDVERAEDFGNSEVDELDAGNVESGAQSPESDSMEFLLKKAKFDSIPAAAIVIPIIFTILSSLGVIYYLRQKKVPAEEFQSMVERLVEPVLAEKITPPPSTMEEEESDGAEFFASTSSLVHSLQEEVAKDISHGYSQSHAPSVELLGEFVIGEVSSSLRSCAMKSRNSEKEESHNSVSQRKKGSLVEAPEVSSHAKTSNLDLSSADSTPLDGTSASEKKRGKDAEETPVRRSSRILPSPVRRSSRLRDRSAMSP